MSACVRLWWRECATSCYGVCVDLAPPSHIILPLFRNINITMFLVVQVRSIYSVSRQLFLQVYRRWYEYGA